MPRKTDAQQIGAWRDVRRDRPNFEPKSGRPDRGMAPASALPEISEDMGWPARTAIVRNLRALVQTTYQSRNKSDAAGDAWRDAGAAYRTALAVAFKPEFLRAADALRDRQDTDLDPILQFLEADPYFYGSGYMKENVLRRLKRVAFSDDEAARIRALILRSVCRAGWSPRVFPYYARLAPKVISAPLRSELHEAASGADSRIAERARHVLRLLEGVS